MHAIVHLVRYSVRIIVIIALLALLAIAGWAGIGSNAIENHLASNDVDSRFDVQSDLIAHWAFNEGSGNFVRDITGHEADCTINNAVWESDDIGTVLDFNGINSYLEVPDPNKCNLTGSFTISFVLKPYSWKDQYSAGIISKKKTDSDYGYVIYADGNYPTKINLRIAGTLGNGGLFISKSDVDIDVWQHWAVTYDTLEKEVIWYKNGVLDKKYRSVTIGDTTNGTPLHIGHAHTWNGYYDGRLADMKIYNRTLTADEVKTEYKAMNIPIEKAIDVPVEWRVIQTHYPTSDFVVAGCTVKDAGAKGDGKSDDTKAFQSAMNKMAEIGGGTVWVPEGRYAIKGSLHIPTGVTLRGDWVRPSPGSPIKGSILMAYSGRGQTEGRPFIALRQCSGVMGVSIWYPDQKPDDIKPYPFCIQQMGAASGTVSNVTLVNAYQGVRTNNGSYLHYIHSVYGSPLSIGIQIDFVSDTGRVDDIHFNPDIWSDSGLPDSPARGGPHALWIRNNGIGMLFRRYEWIYSAFANIEGYNIGLKMVNSPTMGETNGQMYEYNLTDCNTAVDIINANFAGLSFTKCKLWGRDYGIYTHDTFNSRALFHSCDIRGGVKSAFLDGIDEQSIIFQNCTFANEIERVHGDLVILGCTLTSSGNHVRLDRDVGAITLAGNRFDGEARIVNESASGRVKISQDPVSLTRMPDFPQPQERKLTPTKPGILVVAPKKKGIKDYTKIFQDALDTVAKVGGGIVFIPGGIYPVKGNLVIPSGVELRGVYDVPHHAKGFGSVLQVYSGRGREDADPFIIMQKNSGIRGISFYYPEQQGDNVVPYPFLIQGRGPNIYVVNVNAMNPYKMLDFKMWRCDNHYIDYPSGAPLRIGVAVGGGSKDGAVVNAMFNSNNWAWSPYPDSTGLGTKGANKGVNMAWIYQYKNLEGFVFGDCVNEMQYENSIFGSNIGLHFVSENGKGASGTVLGHGTDGSLIPVAFDGLGPNGIDVINSQLVAMSCAGLEDIPYKRYINCGKALNSQARLFNTTLWGTPNYSVTVDGGSLDIELASFCMYAPFLVNGGELTLTGVHLLRMLEGDSELIVRDDAHVKCLGTISPGQMRVNEDADQSAIDIVLHNESGRIK